jgi:Protein of unknown function (DUF3108)
MFGQRITVYDGMPSAALQRRNACGRNRPVTPRVGMIFSRLAIVLCMLLPDAGLSLANAQQKLEATYAATLLGLPFGHISWTVELYNNRFTAAASGALSGLLRIFSDGHGEVSAHGTLSAGRPVASNFSLRVIAGKWTDEVRIVFHGGKAQEYVATPLPQPNPNQVPITDANRIGVLDPMTALLIPVAGTGETAGPEACERTIAIFDGHTRYNLHLAPKRVDKVNTPTGYKGPVMVCSVKFLPVAGYDPKHFLVTYLAAQPDMEVWLAPFAGSRLIVPYRLSVPTPFGLGILQATKFESLPARPVGTDLN